MYDLEQTLYLRVLVPDDITNNKFNSLDPVAQ